ncbi:uncharacterized protein LOC120336019 [Styela clava]
MEDLTKAEAISKSSEPNVGMKYIAIARSNIPLGSDIVSLGDDASTSCDILSAKQNTKIPKSRIPQMNFAATNFPLDEGKFYEYFMVTTTPGSNEKVHFGMSTAQSFKCYDKLSITATQSNNITLIGESVTITLQVLSELGEVGIKLYKEGNSNILDEKSVGNGTVEFTIGPMNSASEGHAYMFKAVAGEAQRVINITIAVHEKANIANITPSRIAIPSNQNQTITCYATGFPSPSVLWYFKEKVVSRNTISYVHQTNSSTKSVLYFKTTWPSARAESHAGVYSCRVSNYVGEYKNRVEKGKTAKVIEMREYSASPINCSSDIEVRWIPGVEATNIKHKITLLGENYGKTVKKFTPSDNQMIKTIFTNLTQQSLYIVKMAICLETWKTNPGRAVKVKTAISQAGEIPNVKLEGHATDKTCKISWSKSNDSEYITGFKVSAYSTLVKIGFKSLESEKYNDTFDIQLKSAQNYSFDTKPNRNYTVFIQGIACDKPGIFSKAVGNCISDTEAPSVVAAPKFLEDKGDTKTRNIQISAIDQSNGTISCIFIIVGIHEQEQSEQSFANFTMEDLKKAEENSKSSKPNVGMKYIAIARSNIPIESTIVSIGDDASTSCDIRSATQKTNRRRNGISQVNFAAKNFLLDEGKFYGYFMVTTTPGANEKIHFGRSATQSFKFYDKLSITATQSNNITLIGESVTITLQVLSELGEVEIKLYKEGNSSIFDKKSVGNGTVEFIIGPMHSASEGHAYMLKAVAGKAQRVINITIAVHEKANIANITPSRIAIPTNQTQTITCYATGFPSPSVLWYFEKEAVSRNTISDVYQTSSLTKSVLYFKTPGTGTAAKSHAGVYTCSVINYVGDDQNEAGSNKTVKVIEMPEYSASSPNCSSDINVRWIPGVEATHIKHRITLSGSRYSETVEITPSDNKTIETIFTNLTQQSLYTVEMSLCLETCITNPGTEIQLKTSFNQAGVIPDVKFEKHPSDKACKISWSKSNDSDYITGFKISVHSTLIKIGSKDLESKKYNDKFKIPLKSTRNYSFHTTPNRNYTVSIYAIACNNPGILSTAAGDCTSDTEAPSFVAAPKMLENKGDTKTRNIEISTIDQSNGPISCIFVVVDFQEQGKSERSSVNFTIEDLKKAEANSKLLKPQEGQKYIAIARSNIPVERTIVSLGDDASTSCDIHSATQNMKRKKREISQMVLAAKNFPLNEGKFYEYFMVTTTPGANGNVHLGTSASQSFRIEATSTTWLIVVIIIAIVVTIMGATALLVCCKRRQSSKYKTDTSIALVRTATSPESYNTHENVREETVDIGNETRIYAESLLITYNRMKTSDNGEFKIQFEKLKKAMTLIGETKEVASLPNMTKKNRYKNILPYDSTRVVLNGEGDKDYINASYIHGYETRRKFIASQGPLPVTVNDFWRMVIEQKCAVIIMLTGLMERGKKKCEKYWPDVDRTASYESIFVKTVIEEHVGSYIKRTFEATSTDGLKQTITHFQFTTWPDHGVPVTTSGFFRLHKAVSEINSSTPVIVHCSAGAGRTGTYIAYDYLLNEVEKESAIDVYECVHTLRKQRVEMVQTADQYIFVHKLLVEHYLFDDTEMDEEQLRELMQSNNADQFLLEFQNLSEIPPMNLIKDGKEDIYRTMNRNQDIIPYKRNKVVVVRMPEDTETPYINASVMETYEGNGKVIAAQGPMRSTVEYFWRAIMDNDVSVIVMLTQVMEEEQQQCFRYWPDNIGGKSQFGNIRVELIEESSENEIILRRLIVTRDRQSQPIIHYQHPNWSSERSPVISSVLNLVSIFQKFSKQQKLVHCSDGAGRTGVFCAVYNLFQRFKVEKRFNVFQTVKDLRDCRPGMVQTEEQYKLCYDIMLAYIDSFSLYENINRRAQEVSGSAGNESLYENISAIRKQSKYKH